MGLRRCEVLLVALRVWGVESSGELGALRREDCMNAVRLGVEADWRAAYFRRKL